MLLIVKAFHLHYLLCELGMGGSIGKMLGSLLVLELATLQVCSLEKDLFGIGRNLTLESFEQSFGWVRVID